MKSILVFICILGIFTAAAQGKQYYVFKLAKVNWYSALADCFSRNLQLATINSVAEQRDLERAMRDAGMTRDNFWIAGADLAEEGTFLWMSTGRGLSYTNWAPKEPNNHDKLEHCMLIWNIRSFGSWNDVDCLGKFHGKSFYICEDK